MEKKKVIKIIIISVVILVIIWVSMLVTDIIRPIYFNKKPIFAIVDTNTIMKDGGSAQYNGCAYSIQTHVRVLGSVTIENIEVKVFNIFKFRVHGHNHS